jgi:hypothetical protein
MKKTLDRIVTTAFVFVVGVALGVGFLSMVGAKHQVGCGGDLWTYSETLEDQTATFTSTARDLVGSDTCVMTIDCTEIGGAAPTLDVAIYSGTSRTKGYTTGVTFTQLTATGSETKYVQDKKFHQYIWAVATMGGTITTVDLGVYVTGKP